VLETIAVPANSDFHPYVDLNAPRLRYLRANAMELPALTVLPIPFLELIGAARARGVTLEPSAESGVIRDHLVQRALDIRRALLSGNRDDLDPLTAQSLGLIGSAGDLCALPPARSAWQDAVRNISDETAAYLTPVELQSVWNRVDSSPCYRSATGTDKAWVDLWAAIARRDEPAIAGLGAGLLAPQSAGSSSELAYLTTVTAAADVGMGQSDRAQALLRAQWGRFDHAGQFDFALRELRAMTQ
jgi:hypothetical protein